MNRFLKFFLFCIVALVLFVVATIGGKIGWNRYQANKDFFTPIRGMSISSDTSKEHSFYAGVAQKIITPASPVYLGGFNFNRKSTGIHDDLYAKALIIKDAYGTKVVVVSLDLLGFLRPDVLQIQREIERRGIAPAENIIITSTHTHSAPDVIGYYGNIIKLKSGRDAAYIRFIAHQIADAVEEANAHLEPVDLYAGIADGCGFCNNKRFPEIIDNEIRTLFVSYKSGKIAATITNFGCHPEVLNRHNTLITADWPAYMYDKLEQRFGGKAFFINGALGGMVTPVDKGNYNLAEKFGNEMAHRVSKSYEKSVKIFPPHISLMRQEIAIPLENKLFRYLIFLGFIPNETFSNGKVITEINYLTIGTLNVITVPGEITPQIGLAIKQKLKEPKMVWSLANDEIGYIIQKEDWFKKEYKYERTMSIGKSAGACVMDAIETMVK